MKSFCAVLFFALPLFATEVPSTVRVSGGFMLHDKVAHDFGGSLNLISKGADRTHHRGTVQVEAFNYDNQSAEKRINLLSVVKKGKAHLEFALFQNDYTYEFHFNVSDVAAGETAQLPEAGISIEGTVMKYEQYYCGPLFSDLCNRLVDTGAADLTVSY